ncbi:MAG TPA: hypothetical protein VF559_13105 [Caulobacteraceae bacterium]|jgi:hypothetical protein
MPTRPIDLTLQILQYATELTIASARSEGGFSHPAHVDDERYKGADVFNAWFDFLSRRVQEDLDR